ncbi:MAG: hypothetical protein KatS3mg089_0219 [Patescibacteria group bacterium]|nr:MAG: hypothetical protein KatS3mg089_0219 [Patescibacteria group bacterium]
MDNRRSANNTFNIFLLGIVIGVALTLLLTTKNGRKLLRLITEESLQRLSKWEDRLLSVEDEKIDDEDDFALGEDYQYEGRDIDSKKDVEEKKQESSNSTINDQVKTRRFFKGIKKKTS